MDVAGEVCLHFINHQGKICDPVIDSRTVSIPFEELLQKETRVAVVSGRLKTEAVCSALEGGIVNVLICDEDIARGIVVRIHEKKGFESMNPIMTFEELDKYCRTNREVFKGEVKRVALLFQGLNRFEYYDQVTSNVELLLAEKSTLLVSLPGTLVMDERSQRSVHQLAGRRNLPPV